MVSRGTPWIPPTGLAAGHLAHGLSWLLLAFLAARGVASGSIASLSWVHLVGLGWLSTTALSVLLFVIPQFTDARWRGESIARFGLAVFILGTFLLATAFLVSDRWFVRVASIVVASGLTLYLAPAFVSLTAAMQGAPTERAIARALLAVFGFFAAAAALGVAMPWVVATSPIARLGPAIHAHLAGLGWLTLLVMGVSVRTVGAIAGLRSPRRWPHIVSGILCSMGVVLLAAGIWWHAGVPSWLGATMASLGILTYGLDMADVLRRAEVSHRPPQAFLGAALVWLFVATGLGIGVLAGNPWSGTYVYVALVGWLGQVVNGHLHHIGVRLIATVARGDEDETQPGELLRTPLTWLTFACFQATVLAGATGLLEKIPAFIVAAGVIGAAGWLVMTANLANAWRSANMASIG